MEMQLKCRTLIELFDQSLPAAACTCGDAGTGVVAQAQMARAELSCCHDLRRETQRQAEKDCLEIVRTGREEKLTFGQLWRKAREFAIHLIQNRGIRTGDKIAILGKNRADWDVALWGIILAGAVPVLIDPERRVEGVKRHLVHTDAKLLVLADDYQDSSCREKLREFLRHRSIGVVEMTVYEKPTLDNIQVATLMTKICTEVKSDNTAVILCTSGTTGDPREVEITHTNLIA